MNGVVLAIGGSNGLENDRPFNPKKKININLGAPDTAGPKWASNGICTDKHDQDIDPAHTSFTIYSVDYPCMIAVSDTNVSPPGTAARDPVRTESASLSPAYAGPAQGETLFLPSS